MTTQKQPDYEPIRESIFLGPQHFEPGTNIFRYRFNGRSIDFSKAKISLDSLSMYNQTFNITEEYKNNRWSLVFLGTRYDFIIDDGYYSVEDLNYRMQYSMLSAKLYVNTTNSNAPFYFVSVVTNSVKYSSNIALVPIFTSAQASGKYTIPVDATWTWPSSPVTVQLILSPGLGKTLGFVQNLTIPQQVGSANILQNSDVAPMLSVVDTYIVRCNLLNSSVSAVGDIIAQVPLSGVEIGRQAVIQATSFKALRINPGTYSEVVIRFCDANLNPLFIRDPSIHITLIVEY
jgi:hypothetical protein